MIYWFRERRLAVRFGVFLDCFISEVSLGNTIESVPVVGMVWVYGIEEGEFWV